MSVSESPVCDQPLEQTQAVLGDRLRRRPPQGSAPRATQGARSSRHRRRFPAAAAAAYSRDREGQCTRSPPVQLFVFKESTGELLSERRQPPGHLGDQGQSMHPSTRIMCRTGGRRLQWEVTMGAPLYAHHVHIIKYASLSMLNPLATCHLSTSFSLASGSLDLDPDSCPDMDLLCNLCLRSSPLT